MTLGRKDLLIKMYKAKTRKISAYRKVFLKSKYGIYLSDGC